MTGDETAQELWVDLGGQRGFITGSAHTFPGRFHVYVPVAGHSVTCSLSDVSVASDAAHWWLRGFLSGCEPSYLEYLGRPGEDYLPTDDEYERWQVFVRRFRETGFCPTLNKRPDRPLAVTDEARALVRVDAWEPWTFVGERVLAQAHGDWVEADPQPEMDGPFLAGSLCAERGYSDLAGLDGDWSVCMDCGEVTDDL